MAKKKCFNDSSKRNTNSKMVFVATKDNLETINSVARIYQCAFGEWVKLSIQSVTVSILI